MNSGIFISFIIREIISIGNNDGIIADAQIPRELLTADFIISEKKINIIKAKSAI